MTAPASPIRWLNEREGTVSNPVGLSERLLHAGTFAPPATSGQAWRLRLYDDQIYIEDTNRDAVVPWGAVRALVTAAARGAIPPPAPLVTGGKFVPAKPGRFDESGHLHLPTPAHITPVRVRKPKI